MLSMVKARCYSYSQWFGQGLTDVWNLVMICKEEKRERRGVRGLLKMVTVSCEFYPKGWKGNEGAVILSHKVWRMNVEWVRMGKEGGN